MKIKKPINFSLILALSVLTLSMVLVSLVVIRLYNQEAIFKIEGSLERQELDIPNAPAGNSNEKFINLTIPEKGTTQKIFSNTNTSVRNDQLPEEIDLYQAANRPADVIIEVTDAGLSPSILNAKVNDTVAWNNTQDKTFEISIKNDRMTLLPNSRYLIQFDTPGKYPYLLNNDTGNLQGTITISTN